MGPIRSCDTGLVEVNGKLERACGAEVSPGLQVVTSSDRATRARSEAFDVILTNHMLYCTVCIPVLKIAEVALSPVTDLALSGGSWSTRAVADPCFTQPQADELVRAYLDGYRSSAEKLVGERPEGPLASPLYADLKGAPRSVCLSATKRFCLTIRSAWSSGGGGGSRCSSRPMARDGSRISGAWGNWRLRQRPLTLSGTSLSNALPARKGKKNH
jgi:hypothetical protein